MELPAITCYGCNTNIPDSFFLRCCVCALYFDLECAGVPECRFKNTMSKEHKDSWKCPCCRGRRINADTPVGSLSPNYSKANQGNDLKKPETSEAPKTGENLSINKTVIDETLPADCGEESIYNVSSAKSRIEHVTFRQQVLPKRLEWENSYSEDTFCVDGIRAVIQQEMERVIDERLLKIMGKFDAEQSQINLRVEEYIKFLQNKVSVLENKLSTLENLLRKPDNQQQPPKLSTQPPKLSMQPPSKNITVNIVEKPKEDANINTVEKENPCLIQQNNVPVLQPIPPPLQLQINTQTKDGSPAADEGGWTEVKKKRPRSSVSGVMRGTAPPELSIIEAAERQRYIHLCYVKAGTTDEQVRSYLVSICNSDKCTVQALRARGDYASFKLGVPSHLFDTVMAPSNWAKDICIKPWSQNFRAKDNQENKS
ncbi:hypothetical protein NE865_07474 [Phthorimaea operculella]|nr:hypothetical protein NE865_07474 [Phthorimaea operculella]